MLIVAAFACFMAAGISLVLAKVTRRWNFVFLCIAFAVAAAMMGFLHTFNERIEHEKHTWDPQFEWYRSERCDDAAKYKPQGVMDECHRIRDQLTLGKGGEMIPPDFGDLALKGMLGEIVHKVSKPAHYLFLTFGVVFACIIAYSVREKITESIFGVKKKRE